MMDRRLPSIRRSVGAVVSISVLAVLARLIDLGWRVAHQDEARVADWTMHYMRTGTWEYRPIIHGPFIPHSNGVVFTLFGASDFTMRLIPALVGGLLPLVVLLLRDRLRDSEMVGAALILAANPVLLYYSRFSRNDVLLAAFAMFAFAFVVRAIDTDRPMYLYLAALSFGLGTATKENFLLYLLCWAGALVLILDHRLTLTSDDWLATIQAELSRVLGGLRTWALHVIGALALWVGTAVAFYSPKPMLYDALSAPSRLPGVLDRALIGSWRKFAGRWANPDARAHAYLEFAGPFWDVMYQAALPACLLGALGFIIDRYRGDRPRDVVAICFYWAAASSLGYPIVMDIVAAWSNVHAIVPLAIPAGVGIAVLYKRARTAVHSVGRDRVGLASLAFLLFGASLVVLGDRGFDAVLAGDLRAVVAAVVFVAILGAGFVILDREEWGPQIGTETLIAGVLVALLASAAIQTGTVATRDVYENPQEPGNILIQYAQASGEMQPTLAEIERIAAEDREGPDVMFYGEIDGNDFNFYSPADFFRDDDRYGPAAPDGNEGWPAWDTPAPGWFSRLPFPWYMSQFGADVTSTTEAEDLADGAPPVVIAYAEDNASYGNTAEDIAPYLDGYERHRYQLYQWAEPIVIFVKSDA